jgi:hypothetical protein
MRRAHFKWGGHGKKMQILDAKTAFRMAARGGVGAASGAHTGKGDGGGARGESRALCADAAQTPLLVPSAKARG